MTTFLTKAQRQILIDWYIDCLIETESEFVDGSEEAERQSLASMNNSYFYEYVQEMMPSCMKDLAKMKTEVPIWELAQDPLQYCRIRSTLHLFMRNLMSVPFPYEILEGVTLKGKSSEWIVTCQGFQCGDEYDASGAGNLTFSSYDEALDYIHNR